MTEYCQQARQAGAALAAALTPTIIGTHETNLSETDAINAVNNFVAMHFSDMKPLLQKSLLGKMTDSARKHLGLDLIPLSSARPDSKTGSALIPIVTSPPAMKPSQKDRAGTPRPEERAAELSTALGSSKGSPARSPKHAPASKKMSTAAVLNDSISEGDDDDFTPLVGKAAGGAGGKKAAGPSGTAGSWLDVDLKKEDCDVAYAEPLSKDIEDKPEVVAMAHWMGPEAARAAYSHDWKARCAAD